MDTTLPTHLSPTDRPLWDEYARLRDLGLRDRAIPHMEQLVERLVTYPQEQLAALVFDLCSALFVRLPDESVIWYRSRTDKLAKSVIFPLFMRVVLPQLRVGYQRGVVPYARWLAQFSTKIYGSRGQAEAVLGMPHYNYWELMKEAYALDPTDEIARDALLFHYYAGFNKYILDQLWGRYNDDGTFRRELDTFIELATAEGVLDKYKRDLARWTFACDTWPDYLANRDKYKAYDEYLHQNMNID